MTTDDPRRHLPGVDRLLASDRGRALVESHGTTRATGALRAVLRQAREALAKAGPSADVPSETEVARRAAERLTAEDRRGLRPVINATGIILHTNLGRAPIAAEARAAMTAAASGYSNLEFDLESGSRGSRYTHCVEEIRELTGAEDGLVVNNCAGGLLLAMHALARDAAAIVSRGELVEIGGGFRIPEVLESAGTRLLEVGTTNRTRAADYRAALDSGTASVILKVHRSNFRVTGFTEETGLDELAGLARDHDVHVVHDLGSGLLLPADRLGLPPEPRPSDSIEAGADLVIFSGDKLLGGPQAGIIAGGADVVARLRAAPMCRALRVDKVALAGLKATLRLLLDPDRAIAHIPALAALATPIEEVRARAETVAKVCPEVMRPSVADLTGRVGGGTYPGTEVPSAGVRLEPGGDVQRLARALRLGEPSVVGRVEDGALVLDLRTVPPDQTEALLGALAGLSDG